MNVKEHSDPQTDPSQEEEIIELTDVVSLPEDDEAIIDLVDAVDAAELAPDAGGAAGAVSPPKDDEAIIDLVDEVPLQAASEEAAGPAEKIHAGAPEAAGEPTAPVPDAAFQASDGEAEEAPEPAEASFQAEAPAGEADGSLPDAAAADAALPAERPTDEFEEEALPPPGEMPETEENVIEFSGAPADVAPPASEEVDAFALDEVLESEAIEEPEQDFADDIGLALEEEDDGVPAVQVPSGPVDVTADQVEAAVERVLERIFSEKIEAMIGDAIEKAVSKEIEALKAALMEDHG